MYELPECRLINIPEGDFKKVEVDHYSMDFSSVVDNFRESENLQTDLFYVGVSLLIGIALVSGHNLLTPDQDTRVGYVEISTSCVGIDAGVCIGLERHDYTTYNYDNYQDVEEGTENYYRRVEAELMVRAYQTCNSDMSGMEWTSEVSYQNKTAAEWAENENIQLLPCEKTFYRDLNATQ